MPMTLYTAPDCLRCVIVKDFLAARGLDWSALDFKADKDLFNAFYRAHRSAIYRNPEGVEFPILHHGDAIRQGSGEIIAHLLAGDALRGCVTRSDLLHGWISGLNVSACPPGQEENFTTLVRALARGGLSVFLRSDGRRPGLLGELLAEGLAARVALDVPGPAALYPRIAGGELAPGDLARSLAAVRSQPGHLVRLLLVPYPGPDGALRRLTPDEAGQAARMLLDEGGDPLLPLGIEAVPAPGLEPLEGPALLPYRAKVRNALVRADIRQAQAR